MEGKEGEDSEVWHKESLHEQVAEEYRRRASGGWRDKIIIKADLEGTAHLAWQVLWLPDGAKILLRLTLIKFWTTRGGARKVMVQRCTVSGTRFINSEISRELHCIGLFSITKMDIYILLWTFCKKTCNSRYGSSSWAVGCSVTKAPVITTGRIRCRWFVSQLRQTSLCLQDWPSVVFLYPLCDVCVQNASSLVSGIKHHFFSLRQLYETVYSLPSHPLVYRSIYLYFHGQVIFKICIDGQKKKRLGWTYSILYPTLPLLPNHTKMRHCDPCGTVSVLRYWEAEEKDEGR